PLQLKRALNCEPDRLSLLPELLQRHCPDMTEVVIALNWQRHRPLYERIMGILGRFGAEGLLAPPPKRLLSFMDTPQIHLMLASQTAALRRAGVNLVSFLQRERPALPLRVERFDHHLCHAALACLGSPFPEATCLIVDSWGETGGLAAYDYRDGALRTLFTGAGLESSLGFFYMKLTELCDFDWAAGEEWKVMGLAPYGQPDAELLDLLRGMIRLDGLQPRYLRRRFFQDLERLEPWRRQPGAPPEAAADLARTGQVFFAELMAELLTELHNLAPSENLALGGGCALNSSFNGRILDRTPFRNLYVPSAPADDGTAVGAALLAWRRDHPQSPVSAGPLSPYLGSELEPEGVAHLLRHSGLPVEHLPDTLAETVAALLAQGKIVAWVQGRAEFGPRALGNRSLLADPRPLDMADRLNATVKFRERFRPFAPAILHEHGPEYFEDYQESPYMERALRFRPEVRERVPAVVHVDGTGRLQSVKSEWNPRFHRLLSEFHRLTGVPLLLNTSFNVMGKPMVHSVEDAVAVFLTSGVDALAVGDYLFRKPRGVEIMSKEWTI
ncbi:MAG TPA: carbamoyltransferase C-terminal domain-containing protein, partial [Methylococcaceae bacterium]|nr:carbamoyltransferase C-terminal domain-containing protein [Methylococcaceae bacterium]